MPTDDILSRLQADYAEKDAEDAMSYKMTCTAVDYDNGEITYTLANVEDVVNFVIDQVVELPANAPSAGDHPLWIRESIQDFFLDNVALPLGVSLEVQRDACEDAYQVRCSTQQPMYCVVHMSTAAYRQKSSEMLYWADRLEEVRGAVATLEAAKPTTVRQVLENYYGVPPAAVERPCSTCTKPNDVGVKTCWCCGNAP